MGVESFIRNKFCHYMRKGDVTMNKEKTVLIKTNKLCKTFNQGDCQENILKNIDMEIYNEDFTVIMGASGSGKSTLLYMLSGMDRPTLGNVYFLGEDISRKSDEKLAVFRRNHCGFVFQQNNLIDNLTVLENIVIAGLLKDKNITHVNERAKKILSDVGISKELYDKEVLNISGGESQRISVARSVINSPKIIFADEPTGALNSKAGKQVLDLLTRLNREGHSIVLVTHDVHAALRGNRVIYIKDGVVEGECILSEYTEEKNDERTIKLEEFLEKMGW